MFDIMTQAAADTAAIHIKGLDGEYLNTPDGEPVRIVVFGPGSRQFAAVETRQTNRAVKRLAENDGKPSVAPPEQRAAEQAEDLADVTASFENFTYPPAGGKVGADLYRAFYADPRFGHIAQQVLKALRDWGNFKIASTGN